MCPDWYNNTVYGDYVSCENNNWEISWYKYYKGKLLTELQYIENDNILSRKRYFNWHPQVYCDSKECIEYDYNGNFNFITWIKNLVKWVRARYNPWNIESIRNRKNWNYWIEKFWPYKKYINWIVVENWSMKDSLTREGERYFYNEDWTLRLIANYWNWEEWNILSDIPYKSWSFSYFYKNWNPSLKWQIFEWYATWSRTRYDKEWNIEYSYDYDNPTFNCPLWFEEVKIYNYWKIYAQYCENKQWIRSWDYLLFNPNQTFMTKWQFSNDLKEWEWIIYNNWIISSKYNYIKNFIEWESKSFFNNWETMEIYYYSNWKLDYLNHITYYKNWNIKNIYKDNEYTEYYENWNIKEKWQYNKLNEKIWMRYYYDKIWKLYNEELYNHWFIVQ